MQIHGPCPELLNQNLRDAANKSVFTKFPGDSPPNLRTTGPNNLIGLFQIKNLKLKSDRERQILYDITYMWNLKNTTN